MSNYKMVTALTTMGAYVSKLILEFPFQVNASDICKNSFNVYVERREAGTEDVVVSVDFFTKAEILQKGYQIPKAAYPCDEIGNKLQSGSYVAIELAEDNLGKRVESDILTSRFIDHYYRVTMLHAIDGAPEKAGLIFDNCTEEICPALKGWDIFTSPDVEKNLSYGYFLAETDKKVPLVIWLHGAGEGGMDPRTTIWCNEVSNLSRPDMQVYFGGAAHILTPQCKTVWMDDGVEQLGKSNKSIYVELLKKCIDDFIADHADTVDMNRIYVGGMSNGGFMTMRMIINYPDFFAAAQPSCEVFYSENITDEMLESIKNIPIWFVHAKKDELVPPMETSIPTYYRLKDAGADNVHFTFYDMLYDCTGKYKDELGRPMRSFQHAVWNNVLANECHTEIDGTNVMSDGIPVTIWEWVGKQSKKPKETL